MLRYSEEAPHPEHSSCMKAGLLAERGHTVQGEDRRSFWGNLGVELRAR